MIRYKVDILDALKKKGYTTYKMRVDRVFSESAMQRFRAGLPPDAGTLDKLCKLLNTQPGRLLEYVPDENAAENPQKAER